MPVRLFVDTAVLAYAVGNEHPRRAACHQILVAAASGDAELHASVEAVQEFLFFRRLRRGDRVTAVAEARAVRDLLVLHPFDAGVVDAMVDLVAESEIGGRDAVHAATAQLAGFGSIVSTDRAFDAVPGLARLDPESALHAS